MHGTLYLVGTPIGNLDDISFRAIRILKEVDIIAAEDTRVTLKLLNHYNIKNTLTSYYVNNENNKINSIINMLSLGKNVALVSDAGMPCISDPGELLVKQCISNNILVKVVPGPCALISALCVSGLDTSRFSFEGFLTTNKKNRKIHLDQVKNNFNTLIFYEAPHKLIRTLSDLSITLGDRVVSISKEITKIYESVFLGKLSEAIEYYTLNKPKGEYVLVVQGCDMNDCKTDIVSIDDALNMVSYNISEGKSISDAIKYVSNISGINKNLIYKEYILKYL